MPEYVERSPVKAVQPVTGTDPHKSLLVAEHTGNLVVAQAISGSNMMEVKITLMLGYTPGRAAQEDAGEKKKVKLCMFSWG